MQCSTYTVTVTAVGEGFGSAVADVVTPAESLLTVITPNDTAGNLNPHCSVEGRAYLTLSNIINSGGAWTYDNAPIESVISVDPVEDYTITRVAFTIAGPNGNVPCEMTYAPFALSLLNSGNVRYYNPDSVSWITCGTGPVTSISVYGYRTPNFVDYMDGTYSAAQGTVVSLTATPNPGYHFAYWLEADTVYSRTADTVATILGDRTFIAMFELDQHDYVDMGDGILWATCNVGAANPLDYGNYFAWGETSPKTRYTWSTYIFSADGSDESFTRYTGSDYDTLLPEDDAATANWHGDWRMPTYDEFHRLIYSSKNSKTWVNNYQGSGVSGYLITRNVGPCAGNVVFLPYAGLMENTGLYTIHAAYWTSSLDDDNRNAGCFIFASDIWRLSGFNRYNGRSVRPVMSVPRTVTVVSADTTMGSVSGGGIYPHGSVATLGATPNEGFRFVHWLEADTVYSRSADTVATVTDDRFLVAFFEAYTHTVSVAASDTTMGSVTGGGSYTHGTTATLTATPAPCYHFSGWSNADQSVLSTDDTITITVESDTAVTAIFERDAARTGDTMAVVCDSLVWYGTTYTSSTSSASHTSINADGCDSTVTLHLTVNYSSSRDTTAAAINNIAWRGETYTASGDYTDSLTSVDGCDSTVTLHLTITHIDTVTIAVNDTAMGNITMRGAFIPMDTVDLSTIQGDYTVQDGTVLTGTLGGNYKISVAAGATVMLSNMNITGVHNNNYRWAGLTLLGDAIIVLDDNTSNYVRGFYYNYPGIHVPVGATLTIRGDGELTAVSGIRDNTYYNMMAAGIGGGYNIPNGNIVIESGTITTNGGYGASLGGGLNNQPTTCGNIAIHGGIVNATSIGCGNRGIIDTIIITGGTVTAVANDLQAGIGCDGQGVVNNIIITGGTINAKGGNNGAGIGCGSVATVNHIAITGGTITATGGNYSAGIGSGANGHCGEIIIDSSVTSVTATKGSNNNNVKNIGYGENGTCDTIIVGGQPYTDPDAATYTFTGDGSAPQHNFSQPTVIDLGGNRYSIQRGKRVVVQATPKAGYHFVEWHEADTLYSRTADTTVTVTGDRFLVAIFAMDTHAWVDMGFGLLWATCNVGADNPWDYGDYFAWGETQPKSFYSWGTYIWGDSVTFTRYTHTNDTLLPEDDAATANWGGDWRMPTRSEWYTLVTSSLYTRTYVPNYQGSEEAV